LFKFLCVFAIVSAAWWFGLRGGCGSRGAIACPDKALEEGVGVTLDASDVCPNAGYLCDGRGAFQVMRWQLDQGKLRVRVSLPDFVEPGAAREIHAAAAEGIMAWDRHPFPIVVETGKYPLRVSDIAVAWSEGTGAGHAALRGNIDGKRYVFAVDTVSVVVPPIGAPGQLTITPGADPAAMIAQFQRMAGAQEMGPALLARIQATAMHEMGHALGLFHSRSAGDIMFPEYRAGVTEVRASARDLETVDALYKLPNGAIVQ
jgi:hypothetical protein